MMNERLHSLMETDVYTLQHSDSLEEARNILLKKGIHHVPILNGKKLVGMITTWDLFKLGSSAEDYGKMKCSDIMTTKLATLDPMDHTGAAAEVFLEHLFQVIPIINDNKEFLGIITTFDIVDYEYKKEYPENLDKFVVENMS
jgi:predicted transcriptional regulator